MRQITLMRKYLQVLREDIYVAGVLGLALPKPATPDDLGTMTQRARIDVHILRTLANFGSYLDQRINERAVMAGVIRSNAENGRIAVEEYGRDCDGVQYSGRTHYIDATLLAYTSLHDRLTSWADGPFSLTIMRPSEAQGLVYSERDLVLESHEEGHPHALFA